ncbi:MAG: IS4 family transposase [Floccifex sp.]
MNTLDHFFNSTNTLLSDTDFIRMHAFSEKDFSRNRCLTLKNTWWCMMAHGSASLQSEVPMFWDKFKNELSRFTPQAFSKARNKMNFTICKEIFQLSSRQLQTKKSFKGYHLAAVDASKILPPDTPEIRDALGTCGNHFSDRAGGLISLLYDPLSDHIINGILSPVNTSERNCLFDLIDQSDLKDTILILDRGYPGKDVYRFFNQHDLKYIIRTGIGSSTPRYIREAKEPDQIAADNKNKDITQRIIRLQLSDTTEELLVTNILDRSFTVSDFKKLYHLRWPVETKYDEIKNKFCIEKFTGKSLNSVYQDFYNTLTKANIIAYLRRKAQENIKTTGYPKKVNIQASVKMLNYYIPMLLSDKEHRIGYIKQMLESLQRVLIPIRDDRSFPRKKKHTDRKYRKNLK